MVCCRALATAHPKPFSSLLMIGKVHCHGDTPNDNLLVLTGNRLSQGLICFKSNFKVICFSNTFKSVLSSLRPVLARATFSNKRNKNIITSIGQVARRLSGWRCPQIKTGTDVVGFWEISSYCFHGRIPWPSQGSHLHHIQFLSIQLQHLAFKISIFCALPLVDNLWVFDFEYAHQKLFWDGLG